MKKLLFIGAGVALCIPLLIFTRCVDEKGSNPMEMLILPGIQCIDNDGDGYGAGLLCQGADCNDADSAIHPGATEEACDEVDNNCDGVVDETATKWYHDCDEDSFAATGAEFVYKCSEPVTPPSGTCLGWTSTDPAVSSDCNDTDAAIHPGAEELCDGIDNNCDNETDEIAPFWWVDCDDDGYAAADAGFFRQCSEPPFSPSEECDGWSPLDPAVPANVDCDDNNAEVYPGNGCP